MFWLIAAIVGLVAVRGSTSTPCNCAPGYSCGCGGSGATAIGTQVGSFLSGLFDGSSPNVTPASAAASSGSGGNPSGVDSTVLPNSLTGPTLVSGGNDVPFGTPTSVSAQPVNPGGAGFGSAVSIGGRVAQVLYNASRMPGAPSGPTYNRGEITLGSRSAVADPNLNSPTYLDAEFSPCAAGDAVSASPSIVVGGAAGPNKPISGAADSWKTFQPRSTATELSPAAANLRTSGNPAPLPTLSTHPGIPTANMPALRPRAASTPHTVSSGLTATHVAARPSIAKTIAQPANNLQRTQANQAPASGARNVGVVPMKTSTPRVVVSKPLKSVRIPLGYKVG